MRDTGEDFSPPVSCELLESRQKFGLVDHDARRGAVLQDDRQVHLVGTVEDVQRLTTPGGAVDDGASRESACDVHVDLLSNLFRKVVD